MRLSAVRDRNLSLWQSAVGETIGQIAPKDQALQLAIQRAVSLHAVAAAKGEDVPAPSEAAPTGAKGASLETLANLSKFVFEVAQAHQRGDVPAEAAAVGKLKDFVRNYSTLDLVGWMQCVLRYAQYYIAAHRLPPYRDWNQQTPPDINYGVIDWKLPATCKILMVGDWGTRMGDNIAMLCTGLAAWQPDAVIHLGDVYYSGTRQECERNVLAVLDGLGRLNIKRPPFFTIPGNHEYYSGGGGYFDMIDRVNNGLAGCLQRASYFCLRTDDGTWQFLGMDTGYNDRDPVHSAAPGLQASEIKWHRDKLDNFAGTTVLFSHHQLFTARDKLTDGLTPWLNTPLNSTFSPYFDRVAAWFWGHEHNYVVYKDKLFGLDKGRLLGCSAYEESKAENPYDNKYPDDVPYADGMTKVDLSPYQDDDIGTYYNHAMALMEVSPDRIDVSYYQYPSWSLDFTPPKPDEPKLLLKETITRKR